MNTLNSPAPKNREVVNAEEKYVNKNPNAPLYSNTDEWKKQMDWLHSAEEKVLKGLGIVIGPDEKTYKAANQEGVRPSERVYISNHMADLFKTSYGPIEAAKFLLNGYTRPYEAKIETMEYLPPRTAGDSPRILIKLSNARDFTIIFRSEVFSKRAGANIKKLPQPLFDGDFWLQPYHGNEEEVLERLAMGEQITAITIALEGASHKNEQAQERVGKMVTGVGTKPGVQRKIPKHTRINGYREPDDF